MQKPGEQQVKNTITTQLQNTHSDRPNKKI